MATTPEWEAVLGRWRKRKDGADAILTAYGEAKAEYGDDIPKVQEALDTFFTNLPKDHPSREIRYKKVDEKGVYNDDGNLNWPGGGGPRYDVLHPVTKKPVKVPASGWRIATKEDMDELVEQGRIAFKADHTGL